MSKLAEVLLAHGITLAADQRAALAADLLEAVVDPRAIATAIRESAGAVLKERIASTHLQQNVLIDRDGVAALAREIGNNAATAVVLELAVPEAGC